MRRYVLDSWALLAWLEGEAPADAEVQSLLDLAAASRIELSMSVINFGEVYYATSRKSGVVKARADRKRLLQSPIRFVPVDDDFVWEAADLKAGYPIACADAFAAALSVRLKAVLISGDPEFEALAHAGAINLKKLHRKARVLPLGNKVVR